MTPEDLKRILDAHALWLRDADGGTRANLADAYLTGAYLTGANLADANLTGANLTGANLTDANLTDANLTDADLTGANLTRANLTLADLTDAYLTGAYLTGANLTRANLTDANLTGANLTPHQIVPETGAFEAWKCVEGEDGNRRAIKVLVPADAQRVSSLVGRKIRVSHCVVLEGSGKSPTCHAEQKLDYREGEMVRADSFDPDIRIECSHGIHLFVTKKEAEEWDQ